MPQAVSHPVAPPVDTSALTPAMRQYIEQKRRVGEAVLLFRMGDFYETFFDDAVLCARVLGIALTSRNKNDDNPIPLAGIPYHALDGYLKKLVAAGYKVAISEQLEDASQAKGVVRRDVVRIVTAGTLTDDSLLPASEDGTLAALCLRGGEVGLAVVGLAGGRFEVVDADEDTLLDQLVRERPAEVLIDDERDGPAQRVAQQVRDICGAAITRRPGHEFSKYQAERTLLAHFDVATMAGFGFEQFDTSLCAAAGLLQYLQETQKTALPHLTSLRRREAGRHVHVDQSTWRSLEIDRTLRSGATEGSLVHAVDRTVTVMGARALRRWLRLPLRDQAEIRRRQDAIAFFHGDDLTRQRVRRILKSLADVERITSRVAVGRTNPRDLDALGRTLSAMPSLTGELSESRDETLDGIVTDLSSLGETAALLTSAMREGPPLSSREGGFIADGFDAELDRLRAIGRDGQQWLLDYQRREIERTGISALRVGFNRVFGYYVEIPNSAKVDAPPHLVRKQTVKNAERYISDELKKYEAEALTAQERANERELQLFDQLCATLAEWMTPLLKLADALARLDVIAGLAEVAAQRRYVRPVVLDGAGLEIIDGRHPVLDQTLGDAFVPNDCVMDDDARVFVINGPNMAGKSTYIRQVALLTLLAQTGSFVPAGSMRWGLVDRVYARVGSADEIMRGQSTFMVEMIEAANILRGATPQSLVVLDELGRGTSTFDGLSLAWAITEHLATAGCRTLVATHYHEMIELGEMIRGVRNCNVAVRENKSSGGDEGVAFLHRIVPGGANQSYGIHVARLAGVPRAVVERAREVMAELQRGFEREARTPELSRRRTRDADQLALFRDPGEELLEMLRALDPDRMTPMEALQRLKEWQERFGGRP